MLKMAPVSPVYLAVLCCSAFLRTGAEEKPCDHHAIRGRDFVLPLQQPLSFALKWRHGSKTIFYMKGTNVIIGQQGDVTGNGSLVLRKLTDDKAGMYTPEVNTGDGKAVKGLKDVKLCVIAPAPKPTVTEKCGDADVKFTCEVTPSQAGLGVAWTKDNVAIGKKNSWTLESKRADLHSSNTITCTVSNAADSASSGPFAPTCYASFFSKDLFGISIWVFVGGGAGIVVVLILIVIGCCVRARRTRRMRLKEEGELRLEWTNTGHHHPQQPAGHHHHHHHHQHQQQQQQRAHQQQQQQQQQQRAHQHHHHHQQQQQPAGHTGPRPSRSKQPRGQPRPRTAEPGAGQPQPSPRRQAQAVQDTSDTEQPPPLPQPRKKVPRSH